MISNDSVTSNQTFKSKYECVEDKPYDEEPLDSLPDKEEQRPHASGAHT